ncbi:hypothetical protein [Streptomyces europaeiscabiei]|uniref:hypothetical protein n=1 Tax=Streptomyces europaeiscabiei TaxID=146819 RepID=UPI0029AD8441|nr:hypothetical protein [Streptomyces europaeiscabiei]MDX3691872.1 hypothetical protein [Streptomyces europaeiscabiei]
MGKTHVDDALVDATAAKLTTSVDSTLVPELEKLQQQVVNLLGDGLVLQQSSPALQDSYTNFNKSVTEAVQNIREFAKQFVSVKDSVKNLDAQIRQSIPTGR